MLFKITCKYDLSSDLAIVFSWATYLSIISYSRDPIFSINTLYSFVHSLVDDSWVAKVWGNQSLDLIITHSFLDIQ
jgi:hypothetical protein